LQARAILGPGLVINYVVNDPDELFIPFSFSRFPDKLIGQPMQSNWMILLLLIFPSSVSYGFVHKGVKFVSKTAFPFFIQDEAIWQFIKNARYWTFLAANKLTTTSSAPYDNSRLSRKLKISY
jgi:hypothetical protein